MILNDIINSVSYSSIRDLDDTDRLNTVVDQLSRMSAFCQQQAEEDEPLPRLSSDEALHILEFIFTQPGPEAFINPNLPSNSNNSTLPQNMQNFNAAEGYRNNICINVLENIELNNRLWYLLQKLEGVERHWEPTGRALELLNEKIIDSLIITANNNSLVNSTILELFTNRDHYINTTRHLIDDEASSELDSQSLDVSQSHRPGESWSPLQLTPVLPANRTLGAGSQLQSQNSQPQQPPGQQQQQSQAPQQQSSHRQSQTQQPNSEAQQQQSQALQQSSHRQSQTQQAQQQQPVSGVRKPAPPPTRRP